MTPLAAAVRSLARLRGRSSPTSTRAAARVSARRALLSGACAFGLLTLALAAAVETVKPEWRDPEYGHRLRQVRQRVHKRADQPLVLVFGSSMAQMGVSPHAMGFADEPGSPLVYNFGYRSAYPVVSCFQLRRVLDDGLKPRAALVMVAVSESKVGGPTEVLYPKLGQRLSDSDLRRFAPYVKDDAVFRRDLVAARRDPWGARRGAVVSDLLPDWQTVATRASHEGWEVMDRYGHSPFPEWRLTEEIRRSEWERWRQFLVGVLNAASVAAEADQALADLVGQCRARGIAVALCWAPESPKWRALYTDEGRANVAAVARRWTAELGVPVFPSPTHLDDDDFAEGVHLLPGGAVKYSRWLADNHLRPWLAQVVK